MLYKAWTEGWGPEFYWVGVTRRITHARALSGSASAKPKPPQLWPGASPEHQALIEECWNKRGKERRYTVPPKIKRRLCELAIVFVIVHTERGAGLFPMKPRHIWRVQYQLNNDAK